MIYETLVVGNRVGIVDVDGGQTSGVVDSTMSHEDGRPLWITLRDVEDRTSDRTIFPWASIQRIEVGP